MLMKRLLRLSHSSRLSRDSQDTQATLLLTVLAATLAAALTETLATLKTRYNYDIFSVVNHLTLIWRKLHRTSLTGQLLDGSGQVLAEIVDVSNASVDDDDVGVDRPFKVEFRHPDSGEIMLLLKRPRHLLNGVTKVILPGQCTTTKRPRYLELGQCQQSFSYINRHYVLSTLEDRKLSKYHLFAEVLATPHQERFSVDSVSKRYGVGDDIGSIDAAPLGVRLKHSSVVWLDSHLSADHRVIALAAAACVNVDYLDVRTQVST